MQSLRFDKVGRKHLSSLAYSSISDLRAYFEFSAKRNSAKQSLQGNLVLLKIYRWLDICLLNDMNIGRLKINEYSEGHSSVKRN